MFDMKKLKLIALDSILNGSVEEQNKEAPATLPRKQKKISTCDRQM
jgi:hypothetical protein